MLEQYNLSDYKEVKPHRLKRIVWYLINNSVFRLLPTRYLKHLRHALLRMFGAKIAHESLVYSSCTIYAPWNLIMGRACIGPHAEIYNKDMVVIGDNCVISQGSFLCTASHDISKPLMPLVTKPIYVKDNAWVAADAFVGMGVTIGEGAVVGARAAVFKDVEPWTVVGGNPAIKIKERVLNKSKNV